MHIELWAKCLLKCRNFGLNVSARNFAKDIGKMKYLNVAEKNDAAKTIAGLLSQGTARRREGYSVYNKIYDFEAPVKGKPSKMVMTSVSGHLLELAFPSMYRKWRQIDPEMLFDAPVQKICKDDYQPIKRTLEREIRGCQGLIIWTDCDREGENIGFEIVEVCRKINPRITVHRAVFSEITTAAVRRALQNLTVPDKRQCDAVDVRSELDLRTGAVITQYQTLRLQRIFPQSIANKLISYGSCQIPTLGFVVERYKEVEAFIEEPFWKIKVIHTIEELTVEFNWARNRLFDKSACEDYLLVCLADPKATVKRVTVKPKHKWRPTPMDTVEMEKLGSRKLKLTGKETMSIAEKLYTRGLISYPRTETNQFSKEFDLSSLVEQQTSHPNWGEFASRVLTWGPNPRNGNKSDQAHPPIHPTKLITDLNGNEARLYELICRHFLACISKDAVGSETIVEIDIAGEKFTANGLCIFERNYLDVYIYEKWNAKQIHRYEEGQVFEPTDISMHEGMTSAPPLLTEADLIALMEKHGIGTDATHAEHINTIKERGYIGVTENGGFLVPGVIGMGLCEGYDAMELSLSKPNLRASFEEDLKHICTGAKEPKVVLQQQIQKYKEAYRQIVDKIQAFDEKVGIRLNEAPSSVNSAGVNENVENYAQRLLPCPKCNVAPMALKQTKNKNAHFIGCMNFPDCKNVVWLPEECTTPTVRQEPCPQCGDSYYLLKVKFTNAYYKTLFNAPSGWYKTCLHCDRKFRETFNINLDSVKRSGAITGVATTTRTTSNTNNSNNITTTTAPSNPRNGGSKSKKRTATENTIRSYTTSTAATRTHNPVSIQENADLAELFDSNDSFDAVILAAENNLNQPPSESGNVTNDLAVNAFADDDDDLFADFSWGTTPAPRQTSNNQTPTNHINNNTNSSNTSNADWWNSDQDMWGTNRKTRPQDPKPNETNVVRCNLCHREAKQCTVRKDGPNKGRTFYVCPKAPPCEYFQWTDDVRTSSTSNTEISDTDQFMWGTSKKPRLQESEPNENHAVRCNLCNGEAKQFTVKKDGPNKGRLFYVCPKTPPCKYFQWADDIPTSSSSNTSQASTSRNAHSSASTVRTNTNEGNVQRSRQSRKCGLCRKEGHTKLKCPRKAEFEY